MCSTGMKTLILALLVCTLAATVLSCDKFQKHINLFCKFPGESQPCLTNNAQSFASSCCASKGGCNSMEFPKDKVCCFTQACLDRCYPGKGHRMGTVY
ncbi:hypothetical protein Y032_0031g2392 [Ancylostoma ceylanicum]|uniref:Testis-expressed protein 13A/C/D zinc finger domain-containing protein n=3 Tax=Ancylostoma ceylanicum TaxID=53326 RepID=A0A016US33_9BILA|nr:hypothetical protein Y032_0031g2392 [Ancylostoma ceylanicum]